MTMATNDNAARLAEMTRHIHHNLLAQARTRGDHLDELHATELEALAGSHVWILLLDAQMQNGPLSPEQTKIYERQYKLRAALMSELDFEVYLPKAN
jgi:hypothetical protein